MTTHPGNPHLMNAPVLAKSAHTRWILLTGSAAALAAGLVFLAGLLALRAPGAGGVLAVLRGSWLITIFRLLAGEPGVQIMQLHRLNAPDLALLGLIAATHAGLYCALRRSGRIAALIALAQPPLGMLLFLLTHNAGRSAAMGAGLVMSVVMLRSDRFGRCTAWMGLLSGILLLAGDFGTGLAPNTALAVGTAAGYVLMTGWLFLAGRRLFQLSR